MKLILATKNNNKVIELSEMLRELNIQLFSLFDFPEIGEIVEDGLTFEENAIKKAKGVHDVTGGWVLADDSGLVVAALDCAPGIYSARYSGKEKDYAANNSKLLADMKGVPDDKRGAAFVCVMALLGPKNEKYIVEGRLEGLIARELKGANGFGYDPLFWLPGLGRMLAELSVEEKNKISHRSKALTKIRDVLLDILLQKR